MTKYFSKGRETTDKEIIKIIEKNAEYCNWHSYEGVDNLEQCFFGKSENGKVFDNCCYLGTRSWNKYQAELKIIKKNYDFYTKNIQKAIDLIEKYKKLEIKDIYSLLEKIIPLMYKYKKKDIQYFYQMYKDNYLTFYMFELYHKELEKLKIKEKQFQSSYDKILEECKDFEDNTVIPKREVKNQTDSYLDMEGNIKKISNKSKQFIISN